MSPCPPSELAFSQVREDVAAERAALGRALAAGQGPARVLLVASGGCSAVALMGDPRVGPMDLVDPNPAQLHLTALRATAAKILNTGAQLALLGADPGKGGDARVYDALRPRLPEATRAYWDARPEQRAFGLGRVGRFEQLFRELAAALAARGLDALSRPTEALASPEWATAFAATFSQDRLVAAFGEAAVGQSSRPFAEHFAEVFAEAARRPTAWENPFLWQVLRDRYPPGDGPTYMHPALQQAIKAREAPDPVLHGATLQDFLPRAEPGTYALVQTSNVGDWMPLETWRQLLADAARALAPGGALVARRLNGDHDLAAEVGRHLAVDARLSRALQRGDRSFFYREIVVAFKA